jgi:hydroxypyruvate reductase/glycerate 2-kinase
MIIKNRDEISTNELREKALNIVEKGIERVLPENIMKNSVKFNDDVLIINNKEYEIKGRIFVIGAGKASGLMAESLERIIKPENITAGIVNCNSVYKTKKIIINKASHPIPDQKNMDSTKEILSLKEKHNITEKDIVICLISGGGSSLMVYPEENITLEDIQKINKQLLVSGADINKINTVRKHLSKIKGGRLGEFFSPAKVVSLILSDVIGNDLDVIASGPTVNDSSTFSDAHNILKEYELLDKTPVNILNHIEKGVKGEIKETPKELTNCDNHIIGDNNLVLNTMKEKSEELGFKPYIISSVQIGDTETIAKKTAKEIIRGKYKEYNALIVGGETTPELPENHGKGGRNQHYAAVSMLEMKNYPEKWVLVSIDSDGIDFIKETAGAIVDNDSLNKAENIKPYLDNYDSYNLLKNIGNSLIKTGPTGTNVSDVMIYLL